MIAKRHYLGVDVNTDGLTFASLQRDRSTFRIADVRQESLDNVLEFSSRRPNVRDSRRFIEALRRGADLCAKREELMALSLPDRVGRLLLTEVDTPFKSHKEGLDILKWSLKGSLPAAPDQVKMDYQVLEKREDGRWRCVVAAIALPVLEQYEGLVNEAGLQAGRIDLHSLNLYNYYHSRLDFDEEFVLVGLESGRMTVMHFSGKTLVYQRVREGALDIDKLFLELNRTLAEACGKFPAIKRCPVYAHLDSGLSGDAPDLLTASFGREIKVLDPQFKRLAKPGALKTLPLDGALAAALAAAESLM